MAIELIPLGETPLESPTEAPATTAEVVQPDAPARKGKGRPPGSKNKSKPEVAPPEPVPEPVVESPAQPIPIEKKKRQARKTPPESIPEAAPEVPRKTRQIRRAPAPAPTPPPSSPMIAVIPERPRPEDMLRQLQQDARQRLTDSYNIRREGWTAELNSKYK
jgi:protein TonB